MASWETVCDVASSLPGVELVGTAWKVNGKVMVRQNPTLDEVLAPLEGDIIAVRVDLNERTALMEQDPHTFLLTQHWSKSRNPSVLVRLSTVDEAQLAELITDAWRARARKRDIAAFDGSTRSPQP